MRDEPEVECETVHPALAVRDVGRAVEEYTTRLGFRLGFLQGDPPTFAAVDLGHVRVFLEKGMPREGAPPVRFIVDDADALHAHHVARGAAVVEPLADQEYGVRDYAVRDGDGNLLRFGHPLYDAGPPIPVERVEVRARIEKRLAALLADLAEHRRMSLGSCLEEILLHTNDGVGPHSKATLRHIQRLKVKHHVDYDTHASYRFVER